MESLFNKVSGLTSILKKIWQRLPLHCTRTTHCYLSVFFYIQHLLPHHRCKRLKRIHIWYLIFTKVYLSLLSKDLKEFISGISFSLKSNFHCCYFLFPYFFCLSQLFHFFLSLLIKRILLSCELIKMFLPRLMSLKYVNVSK